jgi:hypothetical protein
MVVLAGRRHEGARLTAARALARALVVTASLVVLGSLAAGCSSDERERVAVYGDSLTVEAATYLEQLAEDRGLTLAGKWYYGTALCDWVDDALGEIRRGASVVVLAFAGNQVTDCVGGRSGESLGDLYEADARRIAAAAAEAGVDVVLVGPPDMDEPLYRVNAAMLRERFERVASQLDGVSYVDSRPALSPNGYAERLPCDEDLGETPERGCSGGTIVVRHPDGVHWDAPGDDGFSAGANRWAHVLLSGLGDD